MNRRHAIALLPAAGALAAATTGMIRHIPAEATEQATTIPAEKAMELIQRLADTEIWRDTCRRQCEEAGIDDPEEIESEMDAWQNDLDDLINYEEDLCRLVLAARELLGRGQRTP